MIGVEQHPLLRVHHGETGVAADDLGHQAAVPRVDVLDDDDGRAQDRRQVPEQDGQRVDASG